MPKKPSELINGPSSSLPVDQPPTQQQQPVPTTGGRQPSALGAIVVLLLAGVLLYTIGDRFHWWGDHKQDDQHQQEDDKKHDDKKHDDKGKLVAKPGFLHVIRERIDGVDSNESVDRIAAFATGQTDAGIKLGWRDTDKDDPSDAVQKMIAHAKSKSIDPPFVLFKNEDKELKGVIKLPPADATDAQIMEVFK